MLTEKSLNQYVGNLMNFAEFERLSLAAIRTITAMTKHREGITHEVTLMQNEVSEKYMKRATIKALRNIRLTRIAVGVIIVTACVVTAFWGQQYTAVPSLLGLGAAIYFFREGYTDKCVSAAKNKVYTDPAFIQEMKAAQEEDQVDTDEIRKFHQDEINRLLKQGTYNWLCKAWETAADEIKKNANSYGISDLIASKSNADILEIAIRKMPSDSLETTTYGMLIQKTKTKAVRDWQECKRAQENINIMLDQIFKK